MATKIPSIHHHKHQEFKDEHRIRHIVWLAIGALGPILLLIVIFNSSFKLGVLIILILLMHFFQLFEFGANIKIQCI